MPNSQEERIKKIFKFNRIKTKDVIEKLYPQKVGAYYNEIRRVPLSKEFINGINKHFGIDLEKELKDFDVIQKKLEAVLQAENDDLKEENTKLKNELIELSRKLIDALSKGKG